MILPLLVSQMPNPVPRPKVGGKDLAPVPAPGTQGWSKVAVAPDDLVRRADARLNGLRNTIVEWFATVLIPSGYGESLGRSVLYTPGRFRIETLRIGRPDEGLLKLIWTGDGKGIHVLGDAGWQPRPEFRVLPQALVSAFPLGFDAATMRATQGAKTYTTLLASARKLGFSTLVEHRVSPSAGPQVRLLLTKGTTRYAINWSERQMLPNEIWLQSIGAKGKPSRVRWLAAWGVKRSALTSEDVKNFHPSYLKTKG